MPFPQNWLEELVAEWLELDGFLTLIGPPIRNPTGAGGAFAPDIVGAKVGAGGRVEIRHCETAMFFAKGAPAAAIQYTNKFSRNIRDLVWDEFRRILAVSGPPDYEPWVICCEAGTQVQSALQGVIQNLQLQDPNLRNLQFRTLKTDFLPEVRATIGRWRQAHPGPPTGAGLPGSKWLLSLLDYMIYYGFWP
jgi:hypothetical protein